MRGKTGLGQRRNGLVGHCWSKIGAEPGRAHAHLADCNSLNPGQRLSHAPDASAAVHSIDSQREFRHHILLFHFDDTPEKTAHNLDIGLDIWRIMQREFPLAPLVGVGAVVVDAGRVLLIRRGNEPMKGHWSLPGGLVELGEGLLDAVAREVREETGLIVEPLALIELLDRIHQECERIRYHYVIADYLCRVAGGALEAASDADAARWVEREEWLNVASALDPVTVRVVEAGWQRAQELERQ
jgi:ADP-ribose pyrophosphatase YjhB (NUDIX family)